MALHKFSISALIVQIRKAYFGKYLDMAMVILIVLFFLKQFLWSAFIPLWHFPDEQAHFAQVQNIAEGNSISFKKGSNTTSKEIYESEVLLGVNRDWAGNNKFTYHPEYNIEYTDKKIGLHEEVIKDFPRSFRSELVIKEATGYPPLYYLFSAGIYRLFYSQNLFVRVFAIRFANLVFFLTTLYITFQIGRLLFPKNRLLQKTLILFVGFHPMFSFLSVGINSSGLFNTLFSIAIYLSLLTIVRGLKVKYVVGMIIVLILGVYTKHQGRILPFLYIFPLVVGFLQTKKSRFTALVTMSFAFFIGLGIVVRNMLTGQQFIPEIAAKKGSYRLPNLSFFEHLYVTLKMTIAQTIPWYWGVFRWLNLTLPRSVNRIINRIMIVAFAGLMVKVVSIVRKKKIFSKDSLQFWFLVYASAMYYFAIVVFDYLFKKTQGFSFGIQGRYFFPTITAHMTLLLVGLNAVVPWKKFSHIWIKLLGLGIIALHSVAFFVVVASYYNVSSLKTFFIQASQYKPFFTKSPFLEVSLILYVLTAILFLWYYLRIKERKS